MDLQEGEDVFTLVRDEVVTGLSFGFQNVNDKIEKDGIRTYTEVKLLEISPTWLPSGDDSRITGVRSTDFNETVMENTEWMLWDSIRETVWDIWWHWSIGEFDGPQTVAKFDEEIGKFRDSFVANASSWIQSQSTEDGMRCSPFNDLQNAVVKTLKSENRTAEQFKNEYKLTKENFESLRRGEHVADLNGTKDLPPELRTLNNQIRAAEFEDMFTKLRHSMSSGELKRSNALIGVCVEEKIHDEKVNPNEIRSEEVLSYLKSINGDKENG